MQKLGDGFVDAVICRIGSLEINGASELAPI